MKSLALDGRSPTHPAEQLYLEKVTSSELSAVLTNLAADLFALYVKTKGFHWHISGPHFRDYHLLLDEQADQIFAVIDPLAERVRKIGGNTLRSIGQIRQRQRILDSEDGDLTAEQMLAELREDNRQFAAALRHAHGLCERSGDVASASLIETWIDEADRRVWFLTETTR